MFKVLTLNAIAVNGLNHLPRDRYEIASEIIHPDAILVRSFNMHDWPIPETLLAVGRAGAGTNNIPITTMSAMGIPVFNAPGANANAVQELVLTALLLSARNILPAWQFTSELRGDEASISSQVESEKHHFVGSELVGKTLGVVGLGAIGIKIANTATALGMRVIGYDPKITVHSAWQLSHQVEQAISIDDLLSQCDFVSFHVPLIDATRHMINRDRLKLMRDDVTIVNFSRTGIVDDEAIIEAIDNGKVRSYICDFPSEHLNLHHKVITLPHLGASTVEAEDNCALMVVQQLKDYLENGNITHAVNFPTISMSRAINSFRITIAHQNRPNILGPITNAIAKHDINILDMVNQSMNDVAYTIIDTETKLPDSLVDEIRTIEGVLKVRSLI